MILESKKGSLLQATAPLILMSLALLSISGCKEKDKPKTKSYHYKNGKIKESDTIVKGDFLKETEGETENEIAYLQELELLEKETLEAKAAKAEEEIEALIALLEKENQRINTNKFEPKETFQTMFYGNENTKVDSAQHSVMEENIQKALRSTKAGHKIVIRGHADVLENDKKETDNFQLAKQRAQEMKNHLVKAGVASEMIEVASCGTQDPLIWGKNKDYPNQESRNSYNRRTEILAL